MSLPYLTDYKVCIPCMTYNHAPYIEDAMNGFVIQRTNFPFVALIIDDASTDGADRIITTFLQDNFDKNSFREEDTDDALITFAIHKNNPNCHFLVVLLKYNFYNIKKGKTPMVKDWYERPLYRAMCEGDDYWTDPKKLQQQVDILDTCPEYSMVCCRARMYSEKHKTFRKKDNYCRHGDGDLTPEEIIRRGGYYIPTCSVIYRTDVRRNNFPIYGRKSPVGDYPTQIWLAMKGKVYYFDTPMAVYRVDNPSAWSGKKDALKSYSEKELDAFRRQVDMLKGFAKDFPQYAKPCFRRAEFFINSKFRSCHAKDPENQKILTYFKEDIKQFGILGRIDKRMRLCGNKTLQTLYYGTAFKWLFRNYLDLFW